MVALGAVTGFMFIISAFLTEDGETYDGAVETDADGSHESIRGRSRRLIPGAVPFPDHIDKNMGNVWDAFNATTDTPVFWKLLRTGTTSIQPYLSDCLNLVMASEVGIASHEADTVLEVTTLPSERRYVNVDTTTKSGIERAKTMGLAESGLADVVVSPIFQSAVGLFDETHKGRFFTVMKHPVERSASMFYYLQRAEWSAGHDAVLKNMTLDDYAQSSLVESNFMVRHLIAKHRDALTPADVELAKKILQRKFLVGLSAQMSDSFDRFRQYFGWEAVDHYRKGILVRAQGCKNQYLAESHVKQNKIAHPPVLAGSEAWGHLHQANWADVALFEYAQALFREQAALFQTDEEK